ncbi:MAG TPA: hypothetical protein PLZ58_04055 [Candidatus Saccharibacteria bacterium]|nr:hypothetical protein [Candidatus Saccharibacteria bacterium]
MLISFGIGAVMGAGLAYTNTADHYEEKARALRDDTAKAEQLRADKSKEKVDELYDKYKNALTVEPVTVERVVTKRLYIKADCDVQTSSAGQVDNGQAKGIVRLGEEADRSVKQVIRETEADYTVVKNQLLACIAKTQQ